MQTVYNKSIDLLSSPTNSNCSSNHGFDKEVLPDASIQPRVAFKRRYGEIDDDDYVGVCVYDYEEPKKSKRIKCSHEINEAFCLKNMWKMYSESDQTLNFIEFQDKAFDTYIF